MNIIVNGGSRGIGKETALYLAKDKNNEVIVTGRNEKALNGLSDLFSNIHPLTTDISVLEAQPEPFRLGVTNRFKNVDILINVAGFLVAKDFMNMSGEESRQIMDTNFFGPAAVIRIVKPLMPAGGHIVNISSMGGFQGSAKYAGLSFYSASKAALASLSECLAEEFKGSGISVNCLALGAVQTEMFQEAFPGFKAPVEAKEMAEFIAEFALKGQRLFNGKIIPVAVNNP